MSSSSTSDVATVAAAAVFKNVSETLKKSMEESKIGTVVPHLDTPPFRHGYSFTQRFASFCWRSPRLPLPKLSQLENFSDLYVSYGESYPPRLDLACLVMATLPLLAFRVNRDYTVAVEIPAALFAAYRGVVWTSMNVTKRTIQVALRPDFCKRALLLVMSETKLCSVLYWCQHGESDFRNANDANDMMLREDIHEIVEHENGWTSIPASMYNAVGNYVPQKWRSSTSAEPSSASSPSLLGMQSCKITVRKQHLRNALKLIGFGYSVPALVFPQQFFFGVHLIVGRLKGPLVPGQKIYHPLDELVTMLPSLSAPSREAQADPPPWGFPSTLLGATALIMGCGLFGAVFGGFGLAKK